MKAKRAICAPISSGLAVAFATRTIWRMLPEVDEEKTVAGLSRMVGHYEAALHTVVALLELGRTRGAIELTARGTSRVIDDAR